MRSTPDFNIFRSETSATLGSSLLETGSAYAGFGSTVAAAEPTRPDFTRQSFQNKPTEKSLTGKINEFIHKTILSEVNMQWQRFKLLTKLDMTNPQARA